MHNVIPHVVLEVLELFEDLILIILELEVFIREYTTRSTREILCQRGLCPPLKGAAVMLCYHLLMLMLRPVEN